MCFKDICFTVVLFDFWNPCNVYKNCKHGSYICNHSFIFWVPKRTVSLIRHFESDTFLYFKDVSFTVVSFIMMKEVCCCLVVIADVYTDFIFAFQI